MTATARTACRRGGTFVVMAALAACAGQPERAAKPIAAPHASSVASVAIDAGAPIARPKALTEAEICMMPVAARANARPLPNAAPREEPSCDEHDPFCDQVTHAPNPKDACFVADDNLTRAANASRRTASAGAANGAWDHKTPVKWLDRVDAHLHLTPAEKTRLYANGFVVLDRLPYASYANAFHDVFQEQLPLYVGVDAIFHAVWRGTELALEHTERSRLVPALARLLKKLKGGLAASAGRYSQTTRSDLDVYLGVARVLAAPPQDENAKISLFANDPEIKELASHANGGGLETVDLFGRARVIDFSQLTPRGHYAGDGMAVVMGQADLSTYFESMMWLSRLEFNLVSRSCRSSQPSDDPDPEETPREAVDAIALADLVQRTGASADLAMFEDTYSTFAGTREDVSMPELSHLAQIGGFSATDPNAFTKMKAQIGAGYVRTARTHFMPQGVKDLPVIATMMGPRVVPDVAPLTRLVNDSVRERYDLGGADVAYVLGHDHAKTYLTSDLHQFGELAGALDGARAELAKNAAGRHDVYNTWLSAILALAAQPPASAPSFAKTDAYADKRIESALTGYGQLRHAFVLLAAQGYDAYGCEIPDAYVDPAPAAFDALLAHVRGMRAHVDAKSWGGLERSLSMLADIAHTEARGAALSEPQKRWLAMVSEFIPVGGYGGDSGEPPKWTGWYFDMFEDREIAATARTSFIADYFTLTNKGIVRYLGAEGPRLGVFIVDAGGEPRAMVGPVAKSFETAGPIAGRFDDSRAMDAPNKSAAWRTSFAVPEVPEPELGLEGQMATCVGENGSVEIRVAMRSAKSAGNVAVTLLDHHADPRTETATVDVVDAWRAVAFRFPQTTAPKIDPSAGIGPPRRRDPSTDTGIEALHVRVEDLSRAGVGSGAWDFSTSPSVFFGKDFGDPPMPARAIGAGNFGIGAPVPVTTMTPGTRGAPMPMPAPGGAPMFDQ